ncbi:hypothetical protein ACPW90_002756 [Providencia rettgeri]|uniref:hypothetical protein n=1 Tax=unclassified Providencia TaxID=2633465 RepID=UPI001BD56645|nr:MULTISPECIES: hypothetical protein [unclassified Providencia]EJD6378619.1 hypothetical protein [Providencia rettgeri]ELR5116259.1 hypothetical protein [Providencia rettgeri]HBK4773210.1 hypothetical protein [Providencia rettgeri]HEF8781963.1 hypothetical protein [Providencia rettgeri]
MSMSWLELVAKNAGVSVIEAEMSLQKRGIYADRPIRPTPKLTITGISFKGSKVGKVSGPIDFNWSGLSSGVWAVTSFGGTTKSNLVGKSSVLEIILWCLRGEIKGLQEDVRSWLSWVQLTFKLDTQPYIIEFIVNDKHPNGELRTIRSNGDSEIIDRFSSEDGFAAVMSRFMMNTFDLQPISSRKKNDEGGSTIIHGWSALSGALYFGGEHKALLGDVLMSGLPGRMLQLYVGLPWASTLIQTVTAKKEIEQQLAYANSGHISRIKEDEEAITQISNQLEQARKDLVVAKNKHVDITELDKLIKDVQTYSEQVLALEKEEFESSANMAKLKSISNDDKRALQDLRENLITEAFFTGLQPSCCPRCEKTVTTERIKLESIEQSCSLCSEPISFEEQDKSTEILSEAEDRMIASQTAYEHAKLLHRNSKSQLASASKNFAQAREYLSNASNNASYKEQHEAELIVAHLEGKLQAYTKPITTPQAPEDYALVIAANNEAKKVFDAGKNKLMDRLNEEILRLANNFGALSLESIELSSDAKMSVYKGNQKSSFSKLTPGERLRIRIATAIALLRVGEELGVGRHPGLLIIDSPGAEETNEGDLAKLLTELRHVATETKDLQIFIASANAAAVLSALNNNNCIVAPQGGYVW